MHYFWVHLLLLLTFIWQKKEPIQFDFIAKHPQLEFVNCANVIHGQKLKRKRGPKIQSGMIQAHQINIFCIRPFDDLTIWMCCLLFHSSFLSINISTFHVLYHFFIAKSVWIATNSLHRNYEIIIYSNELHANTKYLWKFVSFPLVIYWRLFVL